MQAGSLTWEAHVLLTRAAAPRSAQASVRTCTHMVLCSISEVSEQLSGKLQVSSRSGWAAAEALTARERFSEEDMEAARKASSGWKAALYKLGLR